MGMDYDALARMYDSAGALQAKEISQRYKLGKDEIKARLKIASQSSKDTRYGIEMERDAARERVQQAREEMERVNIPRVEIERFVAESNAEIARQELGLRREIFLAESGLARDQLAKDIREMEEIGIPRVEIERYAAEKAAELGALEYTLKRDQFVEEQRQFGVNFEEARREYDTTHAEEARQFNVATAEEARQFNVGASGYMDMGPALDPTQQARMQSLQDRQAVGAQLTPQEQAELGGLQQQAAAAAAGGGGRQATLEREQFQQTQLEQARRYGLDVAKFGADLASTPDTYFQARRFQGVDVPRLMGGAGAQTAEPMGGPTPGVATMGAYLGGQDPYAQRTGGEETFGITDPGFDPNAAARKAALGGGGGGTPYGGPGVGAAPAGLTPEQAALRQRALAGAAGPEGQQMMGGLGMPGTPEDDRYKQIQQIAKTVPPSPYDGLDDNDTNALKLMESIYKKGGNQIAGGEYERLKASGRLGFLSSAGKLLGYDPNELASQYQSYRPAQGSSRLAG